MRLQLFSHLVAPMQERRMTTSKQKTCASMFSRHAKGTNQALEALAARTLAMSQPTESAIAWGYRKRSIYKPNITIICRQEWAVTNGYAPIPARSTELETKSTIKRAPVHNTAQRKWNTRIKINTTPRRSTPIGRSRENMTGLDRVANWAFQSHRLITNGPALWVHLAI